MENEMKNQNEKELKGEIDLRALLVGNLISEYYVENCNSFEKETGVFSNQIIIRDFNNVCKWSVTKQTGFIESIYMGCELPLIIVFEISQNPTKYLLIDGLNRFLTIQKFLSDELRLSPKGIEKATFLENKIFSEIEEQDARDYFKSRGIQILKFSYKNTNKQLTPLEIDAIAKQLYIRYNSGIKLKNEEIQKADYQDDWITQQLENEIKDKTYLKKLHDIYFTPRKTTKTFIESTLMYNRLAITSCYAPLDKFCKSRSILKRIDDFYRDYTIEVNKENIVKEFIKITECLYELTLQDYWQDYPEIHNQTFMMVTYWLIFQIEKHGFISLKNFDWKKYITFFGIKEKEQPFFSYFRVPLLKKYQSVIEYMNNNYKIDLNKYLVHESTIISKNKVSNFHNLPKYNFQLSRDPIKVSTLLNNLKDNNYTLKPKYQRREINDIKSSSFLLESILIGLNVPDILIYRKEMDNNKIVFEVVDGQQRCFTLLGYLNEQYKNIYGEKISSEKEGFSLKGLTVLSDLNNKKTNSFKKEYRLEDRWIDKIKNAKVRVVYIPKKENPYFSVKDYFTRINKTINPLKRTAFEYWNVRYDYKLMKKANEISNKYQGLVLPKLNNNYTPQQFTVNLAYLFFMKKKEIKSFSVQQVANWLLNFEQEKSKLATKNQEDKISIIRKPYEVAFENVDLFLGKLSEWLHKNNKTICELCNLKVYKSFSTILCLYYLLAYIDGTDILNNSEHTYQIIHNFFKDNIVKNLKSIDEFDHLKKYKIQLSPIFIRTIN